MVVVRSRCSGCRVVVCGVSATPPSHLSGTQGPWRSTNVPGGCGRFIHWLEQTAEADVQWHTRNSAAGSQDRCLHRMSVHSARTHSTRIISLSSFPETPQGARHRAGDVASSVGSRQSFLFGPKMVLVGEGIVSLGDRRPCRPHDTATPAASGGNAPAIGTDARS